MLRVINLFKQSEPRTCQVVPFIFDYARKSKRTADYKRHYRNIAHHLSNYEKNRGIAIQSNIFNDAMMEDYVSYLKDLNLMQSTISNITDKTKYMFRRMQKDDYIVDETIFDISIYEEQGEAVFITSEELEFIHTMKIRGQKQQIAKDLFLVGCFTGMRFSDYSKLTSKNIVGNTIQRKTKKTGEVVIIPVHRIIRDIIQSYNNNFPSYENSLQNFNTMIKRICKRAGLTDKVLVERTRGNKIGRKTINRYEMIGSHTARRSFATNAYLAGIQPARIMLITGHKTESSFFKYIRINKKENARELSEHPFFK